MKIFFFKVLLGFLLVISNIRCIDFFFNIDQFSHKCLGEYLTEHTTGTFIYNHFNLIKKQTAIFHTKSEKIFSAKLFDPNGMIVYEKDDSNKCKIAFTAHESGNHQLCIENNNKGEISIEFEFLSGVSAKDYSAIAKKSNLKPIELNIKKLEDMISYLIKEFSKIITHEESTLALNDALSNKIIMFSMITLITMVVLGLVETIYIKNYLKRRKVI